MLTDLDYELLSAYIDGALSDTERAAFEMRLQAEVELRNELDALQATVTLLNNLPLRKAPRDFTLDARYARRTSSLFTSATFSALSTAAAIVLFAVGAYLFSGTNATRPNALAIPAGAAFLPTSTSTDAGTLDKAAVVTATAAVVLSDIGTTGTTDNNASGTGASGQVNGLTQESTAAESPLVGGQLPLFQGDSAQATQTIDDGIVASSSTAASAPSDVQRRTDEATATDFNLQSSAPSSGGETNSAAAMPPAPSEEIQVEPTNLAFAAIQPAMTATAASTIDEFVAATAAPTEPPKPSATTVPTQTPAPTAPLIPTPDLPSSAGDVLPIVVMVLGIVFLLVAVGTTIIRRRNRL